jgi:hypothetical protein
MGVSMLLCDCARVGGKGRESGTFRTHKTGQRMGVLTYRDDLSPRVLVGERKGQAVGTAKRGERLPGNG